MIGFGLGTLRLSPRDFWAITPRELVGALAAFGAWRGNDAPSMGELSALMRAFPDFD